MAPAPEDVGLSGQDLGSSCQLRIPQELTPVSWRDCQGEQGEGQESWPIWDVEVRFTPSRQPGGFQALQGLIPSREEMGGFKGCFKNGFSCAEWAR